jgi:hypothetical protein
MGSDREGLVCVLLGCFCDRTNGSPQRSPRTVFQQANNVRGLFERANNVRGGTTSVKMTVFHESSTPTRDTTRHRCIGRELAVQTWYNDYNYNSLSSNKTPMGILVKKGLRGVGPPRRPLPDGETGYHL